MRFFVEVTPIGQSETQRYCVEAASWQVALQNTRTLRNDAGPISGFSIELTDEGCRAVDPVARLRFMVKQAPDSAPLTGDRASDAPTKIQESPLFKEQVEAALAANAAASGAPPPSAAAASAVLASAPAPSEKMATSKKLSSRTIAYGSAGAVVTREPADRLKELAVIAVKEEPAKVIPPAPVTKPTLSSDGEARVLFHREQDPTAASPLTYREDVLAVAPGTSEEAAARILRKHLEFVQNAIIGARPGKYVNLAIFDQVFEGKPPVLPLVILSWKDWQVEPLQSFPRRAKAPAGPTQASSHMAPAAAQAIAAAVPAFPPRPSPVAAVPLVTKAVVPDPQPAASSNVAASAPPPAMPAAALPASIAALGESLAKANSAPPPAIQAPVQPSVPPPGIAALAAAFAPAQHPSAPPVAMMPVSAFVPVAEAAPVFAIPQMAAPIVMHQPSVMVTETPPPVASETPPPRGSTESARLRLSRPPSNPNMARVRGDELIAILFEEMHDVHFLSDAIEGGAFCLGLALEKLPSRAGIVHLYDINKREFVIVTAIGKGTEHLLARRHGEADPLLAAAMRKRNSVVMNNADSNDEAFVERYELIGGAKQLIISPVMKGGRFLGAIELINPLDGAPFTEADGNALAYMSEQYAEFVSVRGVLIDPERIMAAGRAR